jgi:hypothetical protein
VAFLTAEPPQCCVAPVGKVGMVRDAVNLNPGYLPVFAYVGYEFFLFLAIGHRIFVTFLADVDVGNRGLLMGEYPIVALQAGKFCLFDMEFVIVGDRLFVTFRLRTTTYEKEKHTDRNKNRFEFHFPAKRFFGFPSIIHGAHRESKKKIVRTVFI